MTNNLVLNAVLSKIVAQKDNILAQLDLVLNKNISDNGVAGIVDQAAKLFVDLANVENAIETAKSIIEIGQKNNTISEQVNQITSEISKITKLQEQIKQESNGNNP